jgi:hypothetical protein
MTLCSLVSGYQLLEEMYCLHFLSILRLLFDNGARQLLYHAGKHAPTNTHKQQSVQCCCFFAQQLQPAPLTNVTTQEDASRTSRAFKGR